MELQGTEKGFVSLSEASREVGITRQGIHWYIANGQVEIDELLYEKYKIIRVSLEQCLKVRMQNIEKKQNN